VFGVSPLFVSLRFGIMTNELDALIVLVGQGVELQAMVADLRILLAWLLGCVLAGLVFTEFQRLG